MESDVRTLSRVKSAMLDQRDRRKKWPELDQSDQTNRNKRTIRSRSVSEALSTLDQPEDEYWTFLYVPAIEQFLVSMFKQDGLYAEFRFRQSLIKCRDLSPKLFLAHGHLLAQEYLSTDGNYRLNIDSAIVDPILNLLLEDPTGLSVDISVDLFQPVDKWCLDRLNRSYRRLIRRYPVNLLFQSLADYDTGYHRIRTRLVRQVRSDHDLTQPIQEWSERTVRRWLKYNGLQGYRKRFRQHHIDGPKLVELTPSDLIDTFKMAPPDRLRLLNLRGLYL